MIPREADQSNRNTLISSWLQIDSFNIPRATIMADNQHIEN
jgi:hypothetical protein